jgi:hypothetical protein
MCGLLNSCSFFGEEICDHHLLTNVGSFGRDVSAELLFLKWTFRPQVSKSGAYIFVMLFEVHVGPTVTGRFGRGRS